jgi:hypothetical protein
LDRYREGEAQLSEEADNREEDLLLPTLLLSPGLKGKIKLNENAKTRRIKLIKMNDDRVSNAEGMRFQDRSNSGAKRLD